MQTTRPNSASIASQIAAAAKGGGTYIADALALVSALASATVLKTGRPKCSVPAFLGVTPPTYQKQTSTKRVFFFPYDIELCQ